MCILEKTRMGTEYPTFHYVLRWIAQGQLFNFLLGSVQVLLKKISSTHKVEKGWTNPLRNAKDNGVSYSKNGKLLQQYEFLPCFYLVYQKCFRRRKITNREYIFHAYFRHTQNQQKILISSPNNLMLQCTVTTVEKYQSRIWSIQ